LFVTEVYRNKSTVVFSALLTDVLMHGTVWVMMLFVHLLC